MHNRLNTVVIVLITFTISSWTITAVTWKRYETQFNRIMGKAIIQDLKQCIDDKKALANHPHHAVLMVRYNDFKDGAFKTRDDKYGHLQNFIQIVHALENGGPCAGKFRLDTLMQKEQSLVTFIQGRRPAGEVFSFANYMKEFNHVMKDVFRQTEECVLGSEFGAGEWEGIRGQLEAFETPGDLQFVLDAQHNHLNLFESIVIRLNNEEHRQCYQSFDMAKFGALTERLRRVIAGEVEPLSVDIPDNNARRAKKPERKRKPGKKEQGETMDSNSYIVLVIIILSSVAGVSLLVIAVLQWISSKKMKESSNDALESGGVEIIVDELTQ